MDDGCCSSLAEFLYFLELVGTIGGPDQTLHIHFDLGLQYLLYLFVCVEVLRPSQPNMVMSSAVSLPNYTFTGQA